MPIGIKARDATKILKEPTSKALKTSKPFLIKIKELPHIIEIKKSKTHANEELVF